MVPGPDAFPPDVLERTERGRGMQYSTWASSTSSVLVPGSARSTGAGTTCASWQARASAWRMGGLGSTHTVRSKERGDTARGKTVDLLQPLGTQTERIGGVPVEREIIQDTLARVLIDTGQLAEAAHLLHHRATPPGPRHPQATAAEATATEASPV